MLFGDVALEMGGSFEAVGKLTSVQLRALQKAVLRKWELQAKLFGAGMLGGLFGGGNPTNDDATAAFEMLVKAKKKATGKDKLDLFTEVL